MLLYPILISALLSTLGLSRVWTRASTTATAYLTIPNGDDLHPGAIASVEGVDSSRTTFALGCGDKTSIQDGYAVTDQSDCGDSGVTLIVGPSAYIFEVPAEQYQTYTTTYSFFYADDPRVRNHRRQGYTTSAQDTAAAALTQTLTDMRSVSSWALSSSCTFSGTTYVSCTAFAPPWTDVNNETTEAASSWSTTGGTNMINASYALLIVGGYEKLQTTPASTFATSTGTAQSTPSSSPASTVPNSSASKPTATPSSAFNQNAVTTSLYGLIAASFVFNQVPVLLTVIAALLSGVIHVQATQSTALIVVPSPVAIFIRPSAASVVGYDGTNTTFLVACRTKYNAVTRTNFEDSSNDCKLPYPHTLTDGPSFFALQAVTTDSSITTEYALTCSYAWTTLASCTDYYTVLLPNSQTVSVRSETGIFTAGGKARDGLNANFPLTVTAGLERFSSIAVTTALVTVNPMPATAMPASSQASPTVSRTILNSMEGVSTTASLHLASSTMASKGDVQPLSPAGPSSYTTAATSTSSASDSYVSFAMLATPYCLLLCLWVGGIHEVLV